MLNDTLFVVYALQFLTKWAFHSVATERYNFNMYFTCI